MHTYAEARAALARLALEIRGFPSPLETWGLVELFEGSLVVRHSRAALTASYAPLPDSRAVITLPLSADEGRECRLLLHEVGHYLCRARVPPAWCRPELGWRGEQAEEQEVQVFCDAWRLPADLVRRYRDDEGLAWESGCDLETIARRRHQLARGKLDLSEPPPWVAWWQFTVRYQESRLSGRQRIQGAGVRIEIPVEPARFQAVCRQVHLHLIALTEAEFIRRYAADAVGAWTDVGLTWSDLAASTSEGVAVPVRNRDLAPALRRQG